MAKSEAQEVGKHQEGYRANRVNLSAPSLVALRQSLTQAGWRIINDFTSYNPAAIVYGDKYRGFFQVKNGSVMFLEYQLVKANDLYVDSLKLKAEIEAPGEFVAVRHLGI